MSQEGTKRALHVLGQVGVGASMTVLFGLAGAAVANARPIAVDADGVDAKVGAGPAPAPQPPPKTQEEKQKNDRADEDRENQKFERQAKEAEKQNRDQAEEKQKNQKADEDRENQKFERQAKEAEKQNEQKKDEDRENQKFEYQAGEEKRKNDKADEDRENQKFLRQAKEAEKANEQKKDDDRENQKFLRQAAEAEQQNRDLAEQRKQENQKADEDRENRKFERQAQEAEQAQRQWNLERAAKDARVKADQLAHERDTDPIGSVRAWETKSGQADEAEAEAQAKEAARNAGAAVPPSRIDYRVSSKGGSKGGAMTYTAAADVDDWAFVTGENGEAIPVGTTKDGQRIVLSDKELPTALATKLGRNWSTVTGRATGGKVVTLIGPKGQLQTNIEDLGTQWSQVTKDGQVQPGELAEAVAGTAAIAADTTIGLGQGNLYGTGKDCSEGKGCWEMTGELAKTAVSVVPVGRLGSTAARVVGAGLRVAAPAATELPRVAGLVGKAKAGASAVGGAVAALPPVAAGTALVKAGVTTVAALPKVQSVVNAVAPVVKAAPVVLNAGFTAANRVPEARYAMYAHNVDNVQDEVERVGDCLDGHDCGSAVAGAPLLLFDAAKGRGLTNSYQHAPGCAAGDVADCGWTALDATAALPAGKAVRSDWNAQQFLKDPRTVAALADSKVGNDVVNGIRTGLPRRPAMARVLQSPDNAFLKDAVLRDPKALNSLLKNPQSQKILQDSVRAAPGAADRPIPAIGDVRLTPEAQAVVADVRATIDQAPAWADRQPVNFVKWAKDEAGRKKWYADKAEEAAAAQKELQKAAEPIAAKLGGEYQPRTKVKDEGRVDTKVRQDYNNNASQVNDLAAGTILVDRIEDAYQALAEMARYDGFKVVKLKDKIAEPDAGGAGSRELLTKVRMPNGHVAEMKIQPRPYQAPNEVEHPLYELRRQLGTPQADGSRLLTPGEKAVNDELLRRARALYDNALKQSGVPGLERRMANIGDFADLPVAMQKRVVAKLAREAGVDLAGVKVKIDRNPEMIGKQLYGYTYPDGRIMLYPDAFESVESLVKTLGHERMHVMQYGLYGNKSGPAWERAAYDSEEQFWNYYTQGGRFK